MMRILLICLMLLSALVTESWAQDRMVTGKVTDDSGESVPGANVILKGTTTGTTADIDGNYRLAVPSEGGILVFSFVGMTVKEVEIGSRSVLDISMISDSKQLSEVVVTAQGIEKDIKALGYSATSVGQEEVTRGRTSDVMSSLQGKVAGVNISTASGAPGASTKVVLRGYSSIGGNNNPLYIVDGVPINNSSNNFNASNLKTDVNRSQDFGNRANDINPDDIESVTILKGASATALYGSRAANGVILITTKSGRGTQGLNVSFTSSATFSKPLRLPDLQDTFGQGWSGRFASEENGSWGPVMDGTERLWGNVVDNSQQLKTFEAHENLKDFYETGTSYINTLSLSGGTDLASFYLSYGNVSEDGIVPGNSDVLERNTISLRGSLKTDKVKIESSLNFSNKQQSVITTGQGGNGTTTFQELVQIPRDHSIIDLKDYNDPFNNLDNFYTLYAQNPYYSINENGNEFDENRVYGKVQLTYNFTDWLNATYRLGTDVANSHLKDWIAIAETSANSPNSGIAQVPGQVYEGARTAVEFDHSFILNGFKEVNSDLNLSALFGLNVNERFTRTSATEASDLDIPGFYVLGNASGTPVTFYDESKRRLVGLYGQIEASYKDYMFLTVVARNDWSSTLPIENNSFFYPGANLSFVFTEATSVLDDLLSFGKLRASWGQTGNDADPYSVNSVLIPGQVGLPFGDINLPFNGVNGFEVSNQIGNLSLQPEITTEVELGFDIRFFENRLGVDLTYYDRSTTEQILNVPVAVSSGYTNQVQNLGEVSNKGIELLVNITPVKTSNFSWDMSYNFTRNRNEVVKLNSELDKVVLNTIFGIELIAQEGKPLGTILGHTEQVTESGEIIVSESNGIPLVATDKVEYGNMNPDYTMGLSNRFAFKGISLNVLLDYRKGGLMYSYTQRLTQFVGNSVNTTYNQRRPFIVPNSVVDNGDGTYSENFTAVEMSDINNYWNQTSNNARSRDHVFDRSFLKLREVGITYQIPQTILDRTFLNMASLSFVGRNLLLFTPEDNQLVDPESTTFGNDLLSEFGEFASGPTTRSFGVSLKANF